MSRSNKKPIVKDKGLKDIYWRKIRSKINQLVRGFKNDPENDDVPNPKSLMNDYSYSDYTIDFTHWPDDNKWKKKAKRK
jgi:hypothetical protein